MYKKDISIIFLSFIILFSLCTFNVNAIQDNLISTENSILNINENVKLDNFDLYRIAISIENLEKQYKEKTILALDKIGTVVPNNNVTFDTLSNYIVNSQKIKSGNLSATSDNLPKNTAAWVDGKYIIGNGKDIDTSYDNGYKAGEKSGYDRGYEEGFAANKAPNGSIVYTYHTHTKSGVNLKTVNGTTFSVNKAGCYVNSFSHSHTFEGTWSCRDGDGGVYGGCYEKHYCSGTIEATESTTGGYNYSCSHCDCWSSSKRVGKSCGCVRSTNGVVCGVGTGVIGYTCPKIEGKTIESATIIYN